MSVDHTRTVEWDRKALTGWIVVEGKSVRLSADRDTIHKHAAGWDDALTWEIDRFRNQIFDKLKPHFVGQSS